jgi:hypothetical protein
MELLGAEGGMLQAAAAAVVVVTAAVVVVVASHVQVCKLLATALRNSILILPLL